MKISSRFASKRRFRCQLNKRLGLNIHSKTLDIYRLAFTHGSSNLQDKLGHPLNFERLEFLGDAIINLIVIQEIHTRFHSSTIKESSELKTKLNSRKHLNQMGEKMKLMEFIQIGESHPKFGDDIHGNLVESLIGAIFADLGYEKCKDYYLHILKKYSTIPFKIY
ncbi:MAG: ribonuclease III domain-containing protein [Flavobacteriaceae bacterium]|nr:ribonuclease III domain-containing protein [Flavobacteriaceae bacterium]MCY4267450.1 ribonuclease III domain-containing protein [Flavobacteriaceae bacterium]